MEYVRIADRWIPEGDIPDAAELAEMAEMDRNRPVDEDEVRRLAAEDPWSK